MTEAFSISIEGDTSVKEVAALLGEIGDKIIDEAKIATTNKQMTQARTQIKKDIAAATGVPSKALNNRFKITRANKRIPRASMFIGTLPVAAIKLKPTEIKSGGVSHGGPGGRVKKRSAFIATMSSGHRGVFQRKGKPRLPIVEQRVPIISAARAAVDKQVKSTMPAKLEKIYNAEFNFRVNRAIARRRLAA